MQYRVLIVDDEEPARDLLKSYAEKVEELEVVGLLNNALDAIKEINSTPIDILLTDIQMEDLTGIDLVKTLKNPPITIFTTAYSEYALEGFNLDIADYLVKPITFQQFYKAINKAIELIQFKHLSVKAPDSTKTIQEHTNSTYFFVKTNRKMVKVAYADLLFIESYGEYVKLYTKDDVLLALQRTSFMEEILPSEDFVRVHRSHIINVNQIKEIDRNTVVIDRHRILISKRMKEQFMNVIRKKGLI